jgi:hypothetical protein
MAQGTSHTADDLLDTARRRSEVIELRESGATWAEIADAIENRHGAEALPNGWDRRYAYKDFHRVLGKVQDEVKDRARSVRELEMKRLNRMQRGLWEEATSGDTDAARTVLRLMKRRAKLLGLDEPDELDVTEGFDSDFLETLLDTLEDYPEARRAVGEALDDE